MNVAVTGGTHGNEYTGVWLVKRCRANPALITRPSLQVETYLNNPQAIKENRRFIDTDLNRAFSAANLADYDLGGFEHNRAKAINTAIGPKGAPRTDFVIDLHTSTANMGVTFCLQPGDLLAFQCAAYVQATMAESKVYLLLEGATQGSTAVANMTGGGAVATVAAHGFEIEVGPTPQGVLRDDCIQLMERAMQLSLDFLEAHQSGNKKPVPQFVTAYQDEGKFPWSLDSDGFPTGCTHESLQGRDFQQLKKGDPMLRLLDGSVTVYDGDEDLCPVFVNEGAYYSAASGLGIGLARKVELSTSTMALHMPPASKL
jgi:aspartoacylase